MEYRRLGGSDVTITPITLGTWAIGGWMWGGQDETDALAAIERSIGLGITSIDTAPAYGFGRAEELIGQAIAGKRDKVQILTKYGLRWDTDRGEPFLETYDSEGRPLRMYRCSRKNSVLEECERSLRRLRTDAIDVYQCHWRDHTTRIEETMEAIDRLLKDGKIRASGVSNFSVEEIQTANQIVPQACAQPPFSMLNRRIEHDVLPFCRQHNIGVVAYSPLQRGLLTGKVPPDREFPLGDDRRNSPYFTLANRRRVMAYLNRIRPIAEAHKATLAQLVINWTIHQPGITGALVGARNAGQAEENALAAGFTLSQQEMDQINVELDQVQLDVGQQTVET